eukprot:3248244-Rhodomonas_salina.1
MAQRRALCREQLAYSPTPASSPRCPCSQFDDVACRILSFDPPVQRVMEHMVNCKGMLPVGKSIQLVFAPYRLGRAATALLEFAVSTRNCTPLIEIEGTSRPLPLTSGSFTPGKKNCGL